MTLNLDTHDKAKVRFVPKIIFIILPGILYSVLAYYTIQYYYTQATSLHGCIMCNVDFYFTLITRASPAVVSITILSIVYSLVAIRYSMEKYFNKRMVVGFEYVKKIMIAEISLLGSIMVFVYLVEPYLVEPHLITQTSSLLSQMSNHPGKIVPIPWFLTPEIWLVGLGTELGDLAIMTLLAVIPGGLLRITFQIVRKEFRFYFAKACFIIISKEKDDYKKIKYLLMGLDSYNQYLRRTLRLEIKDIKKIFSKFVYAETAEKQEIIKSVCESIGADDRLKLARYLSSLSNIPETELFVETAALQKLKTIGAILAAVIPIIISAIELLRPLLR